MARDHLTRRRYSIVLTTGIAAGLAGCTDGDTENDEQGTDQESDPQENDTDNQGNDSEQQSEDENGNKSTDEADGAESEYAPVGVLTVTLENEDGDPVSNGVEIQVMHNEEGIGIVTQEITNGVAEVELTEEGDYTVRAESLSDEFDAVEEGVTVEGDEELTLTLEGATGDGDDSE